MALMAFFHCHLTGRPKGSTAGSPKKRKVKDPNRPKRPTSAYFYYVAYQRAELEKQGKKITRVADWTKEVSAKWRELGEKDRKPFDLKAKNDKDRYDREVSYILALIHLCCCRLMSQVPV